MSDRKYIFLVSIVALAVMFGIKKFLPIPDEILKSNIALASGAFVAMLFGKRAAFISFNAFGFHLLISVLALVALLLVLRVIDLLPI